MLLVLCYGPWCAGSAPFVPERRFGVGRFPDNESCRRASRRPRAREGAAKERRMLCRVVACLIALAMASLPSTAQQQAITVFAAASLKNALDDVNAAFTKNTGIKVVASYAATPALMKQAEPDTPAQRFASPEVDLIENAVRNTTINVYTP